MYMFGEITQVSLCNEVGILSTCNIFKHCSLYGLPFCTLPITSDDSGITDYDSLSTKEADVSSLGLSQPL